MLRAMLDLDQTRSELVRPTLHALTLWSPAAERLVLGTMLVESTLTYLKQIGTGPARGLPQTEPASRRDLYTNFLAYKPALRSLLEALAVPGADRDEQLSWNGRYAVGVCRLLYYRRPEALPAADDLSGLAAYWKAHYNTALGAGNPSKFINLCRLHGV